MSIEVVQQHGFAIRVACAVFSIRPTLARSNVRERAGSLKFLKSGIAALPPPKSAPLTSALGRCRPYENFATLLPESNNLSPKANLLRRQAGIKNALQRLISTLGWAE